MNEQPTPRPRPPQAASPAPVPRWLGLVGGLMVIVGVIGFVADLRQSDGGLREVIGGFGLAIDIALDLFLVAAGVVMLAVARRR